jgi:hypothetical protein
MSAVKLTPRRTISVAKECRSRCGFTRPVHPAARAVSEQLEKMMGSSDSLANSNEVDSLRSGGGGWKRELGNEVEYDGVLAGAVKFTLQIELDHFYIAHGHVDIFVPQHLHECRQADPETHYFCCEGVPQPVRIYPAGASRSPGGFG